MNDLLSSVYHRYTSMDMQKIFSKNFKYQTWRKLWFELAKAQKQLGLLITDQQINQLEKNIANIDFDRVKKHEEATKHEVLAHIYAFGEVCPESKKIIHLGATSSFVMDNTDLIQMKDGLELISRKFLAVLKKLRDLAFDNSAAPCLGFTHLQPAQPVTIGKRLSSWLQDLIYDWKSIHQERESLPFLGAKGATGTQASFLTLFDGDANKVRKLDQLLANAFNFSHVLPIATQTYPRKIDYRIFTALSSLAITCHKIGTDIRLLSHLYEVEERPTPDQIGSSAMPHKQNPIFSERLCSLSRLLISLTDTTAYNAALQWLERSLDDSANRRIVLAQGFYLADALIELLHLIFHRLSFSPFLIEKHLKEMLPFLSLEPLLMHLSKQGKDRNEMHAHLNRYAKEAFEAFKQNKTYDFAKKISEDLNLDISEQQARSILQDQAHIGLATDQVLHFIQNQVDPILQSYL